MEGRGLLVPAEHAHAVYHQAASPSLASTFHSFAPAGFEAVPVSHKRRGLRKMKASITYELSAFPRKEVGYGCQDPANIWLAWKEWALIFQFSQISVCPVAFIKNVKSRDKAEWHSGLSAVICIPGSRTQDLNKEKLNQ